MPRADRAAGLDLRSYIRHIVTEIQERFKMQSSLTRSHDPVNLSVHSLCDVLPTSRDPFQFNPD